MYSTEYSSASFGHGSPTANTDPRPTIERQILPSRSQGFPSLRFKLLSIFAEVVLAPVHSVRRPDQMHALPDKYRRLPIRSAAQGDHGVNHGLTRVAGDYWIDAKS